MTNVHLMQVACSFCDLSPIILGRGNWHSIGLVCSFICFELISLLEAHFEIMHALISLVLFDTLFVNKCLTWLAQTTLVLAHVVKFVASHMEVWLGVAITLKDLVGLFFALLHRSLFFLVCILVNETLLSRRLWHFEILLREVRLSQLVDKLKPALLSLWVEGAVVALEVVSVLRKSIKGTVAK